MEASDAPWLFGRVVLDLQAGFLDTLLDFSEIVALKREVGDSLPAPPLRAMLARGWAYADGEAKEMVQP